MSDQQTLPKASLPVREVFKDAPTPSQESLCLH